MSKQMYLMSKLITFGPIIQFSDSDDPLWNTYHNLSIVGKGKIVHVFNWAPRHEDVLGESRYSSTHS